MNMCGRTMLTTLVAMLAISAMATGITLGGRRAFYDRSTDTWLCSVPQSLFGQDWTAAVACEGLPWTEVAVDGQPVDRGPVTFATITGTSHYGLTAVDTVTGGRIAHNICFTYLPVIRLQGDFNNYYQVAPVELAWPDSSAAQTLLARVKHRGGSTNMPDRNKRNYHLKFINPDSTKRDCQFFGLRNDNSWLLDAGQIDMLRIRNRVATELWLDMAARPYYADREPKALLGVRGDMVEVMLGDNYQGLYALTEAMDRKQLKLAKYDEATGTFRGMLWKTKYATDITLMRRYHPYNNNDTTWYGIEVKYPDPDDVMPTDYATLASAIRFVIDSSHSDFCSHVGEYFDLPVLMDYWILINTLLAIDNGSKNIYWAVYDQSVDKRLTLAAWDLDCTTGQNWVNDHVHEAATIQPERNISYFNRLLQRLHEHNPDSFAVKATERYHTLRKGILSSDSIYNRYARCIDRLKRAGALERESRRWSGDTDLAGNTLDFDGELAYIRQWLDRHLAYLDRTRFRPYVEGDTNRDGLVDIADLNHLINKMLNTHDYPTWYEDLSRDYAYDIADVNRLLNIMLNR